MTSRRRGSVSRVLHSIGPEVLAAASDNDPTNIGTAAAVGAQTGYQLSWVAILVAPLLAVVMAIAAQVGAVARNDLQSLTVKRYGWGVAAILLVSVVSVNVVTMAADFQAGAVGIGLLIGVNSRWLVVPLGAALIALLLVGKYHQVVAILRYLLLGFLAFGAAAFLARPDWSQVLRGSLVPTLSMHSAQVTGSLALLGTTLTSYVYVWETIGRGVEEPPDHAVPDGGLARARIGSIAGGVGTAVLLWFMLVACAATLGKDHIAVTSAQQAAMALRPLAGSAAATLFAIGLVTSALIALPVLMATSAHVVGAQFDWRRGLSEGIGHAQAFYAVLVASVGLALAITLTGVSVIGMLKAASVIAGLGTPVGLLLLVLLARDPQVMGAQVISRGLAIAGWIVALLVAGIGIAFIVTAALTARYLSRLRSIVMSEPASLSQSSSSTIPS